MCETLFQLLRFGRRVCDFNHIYIDCFALTEILMHYCFHLCHTFHSVEALARRMSESDPFTTTGRCPPRSGQRWRQRTWESVSFRIYISCFAFLIINYPSPNSSRTCWSFIPLFKYTCKHRLLSPQQEETPTHSLTFMLLSHGTHLNQLHP